MGKLYDIFADQVVKFADKPALIAHDDSYTYADISSQVDGWASYILSQQPTRPRVGLLTDDPLHTISVSLAIAKLGGTIIPTNAQMMPEQLLKGWLACDVNMVIYDPNFAAKIKNCDGQGIHFLSTQSVPDTPAPVYERPDWPEADDFLIILSSGSTGAPKPIMISQTVKALRAKQAWDMYHLTSDDMMLCASPAFHSLGQRLIYTPLLCGATLVYLSHFTPKAWLDLVHHHRVTYTTSVSSHLYALKDYLLSNVEQVKSLRTIVTSSAPIDAQFKDQLFAAIGCDFHEIYGATEVACASNLFPKDAKEKFATVGTLCDDVDVKVLDDAHHEVPAHTIGEIAVKSPLAFEGYYKRDDLTTDATVDSYFLTGDLGFMDEDGFLSYVARKKDVIISGGINIYPADIENALLQDDHLREVAVIGVDDDLLGEVIVAVCIGDTDERVLRKIANTQLAPFQRPLKYFFVEQFPLTPSGKLSKRALREEYSKLNDGWTLPLRMMLYGEMESP